MKLKHHITGTILALVFATTSALSAVTIPNLKQAPVVKTPAAPKVVATPKVPVVPKVIAAPKVPVVPKVVAAPKVPVVPKVIAAPKVPVVPKVIAAPKIPVVKVPAVKVPTAPKIPAVKAPGVVKVPTVKTPTTPKVPAVTAASKTPAIAKAPATKAITPAVTQVNTAKLKNLKDRLGVDLKAAGAGAKGDRFIRDNFGNLPGRAGSLMDGLKGKASDHDKNPLSSLPAGGGMVTTRGAAASDDPADAGDTSLLDDVINWAMSVLGTGTGGPGTQSGAGTAASGTAGSFASTAFGIMTANTGSPEDKKNEANGIIGIFRQGKKGTSNENAASQLDQVEYQEPVPDDAGTGSSGIITRADIKGLQARKNKAGEPVEEDSGSTGPVNTGANGTGKLGSLAQPVGDNAPVRAVAEDARAMQVRINSRINTGGR